MGRDFSLSPGKEKKYIDIFWQCQLSAYGLPLLAGKKLNSGIWIGIEVPKGPEFATEFGKENVLPINKPLVVNNFSESEKPPQSSL